jgi:RHS repeat-associated protein
MKPWSGDDLVEYKRAGHPSKERDSESNLDYFGARYNSSQYGRFMTPDWSENLTPVPYAKFSDPQTLNLYSYARNNPLIRADRDGHCIWDGCIVEGILAGVAIVSAAKAYYEWKTLGAVQEAYDTEGRIFRMVAKDPNGKFTGQVDLNSLAKSMKKDQIQGIQAAISAVLDTAKIFSVVQTYGALAGVAGDVLLTPLSEPASPGETTTGVENAIGGGLDAGTSGVQDFTQTVIDNNSFEPQTPQPQDPQKETPVQDESHIQKCEDGVGSGC